MPKITIIKIIHFTIDFLLAGFHKEVRPVYPSRRYIILFCISLFAVIMLSTLYTPMFIRLVIISLFLFLCYTFCFKCKIFQITYTIILFFVTSMFSDVIGAFVLSRLGISINELLGISEGRLIYNACHTTHALQSVKHIYSVCPVHYLY